MVELRNIDCGQTNLHIFSLFQHLIELIFCEQCIVNMDIDL